MLSSLPHYSRCLFLYQYVIDDDIEDPITCTRALTVICYPFPSPPLLLLHFEGKRKENTTGTCARKDFFGFPAGSKEDLTKLPITWSCYGFVN